MRTELLLPLLAIFVVAVITWALRALPFAVFGTRELPRAVRYLGSVLPPAIMTILVFYCLRNINLRMPPFGLAEIGSALLVIVLQCIKKNMYISIIAGTVVYMILIRVL